MRIVVKSDLSASCAVAGRTSLIAIGALIGWFFARQRQREVYHFAM